MSAGMDKAAVLSDIDWAIRELGAENLPNCCHSLRAVRAAIADVYAQRDALVEVLESLCKKYIGNRHDIDSYGFVKCVTPGWSRMATSEIGRLWLRANDLALTEQQP